jgi:fluoroacetyl-CoA thioesterase
MSITIRWDRSLRDAVGAQASLSHTVTSADSATNWGNDLPVLATPVLLWLSEIASMKVIDGLLPEGQMTVGLTHASAHCGPTPVHHIVTVSARLERIEGKTLTFSVTGRDEAAEVLNGTHTRAIVDRKRFTDKILSRAVICDG